MKRVIWLTDVHLNFVTAPALARFRESIENCRPDAVLIGGDVAEAPTFAQFLLDFATDSTWPTYFVLGNHDFYYGSIRATRSRARVLHDENPRLIWLNTAGVVPLTSQVALIGHDGWADARFGDYERSLVMMNDYRLIDELAAVKKAERWPMLRSLGDEVAAHLRATLPDALRTYPQVVFLTHIPPFREACWYQGQISNDEWLPHFTCQAAGLAILEIMREHPASRLTVLCGHTHSPGECHPLPNVHVLTGRAEYGAPEIQRVFEFE